MKSPKEIFDQAENGVLTYEEFERLSKEGNAKWADLSEGGYVSKHKYDDDLKSRDSQIETLNSTIGTRDTDLESLKQKLANAGADAEKLATLTNEMTALQSKYDADTKAYQEKLSKQAYEFACKEFSGTKRFSSKAAQKLFTQEMVAENLKFKNGEIVDADEFFSKWQESNPDAFIEEYDPSEFGDDNDDGDDDLPRFASAANGGEPASSDSNAFVEAMHFTEI